MTRSVSSILLCMLLAAQGCSSSPSAASSADVMTDADGSLVAGGLVTVLDSTAGWAETVYSDSTGRFTWGPRAAAGRGTHIEVRSSFAEADPRGQGPFPSPRAPALSAPPAEAGEPPASHFLSMLPDGEESRRLIVDCGGCHTFASNIALPGGRSRSAASWSDAISRMLATAGPGSGFPIISGRARTGDGAWLEPVFGNTPRVGSAFGAGAPPTRAAVLTEFDVPEPRDLPHDLAVDAAGRVLITGMFTHRMYVLDPDRNEFETIEIPTPQANPRAVDIDKDGRWWVALGAPGQFAVYDPVDASWTTHLIATYPHSIALDSMGGAWFNGHFSHRPEIVGRVDAVTGSIERFEVPDEGDSESTIPYGLRVAPDGVVWGTQLRGNRLVSIDPEDGTVGTYAMPTTASGPRRLDVDADGIVWIPAFGAGTLVRFDPATEEFSEIPFPIPGAGPYVVRVDSDRGRVWIGTGHADVLASFDIEAERFTVYPLPTRGALVRHIDIDPRTGDVWAAYGASPGIGGKVARLSLR